MENKEFVTFVKTTLVKIENVINLIEQDSPKHIPAYNKMLGVQQKLSGLEEPYKSNMSSQIMSTRSVINYFLNGRYWDGYRLVLKLKKEFVDMCVRIEGNERDKNK